jgi:predicted dehydrogenase
MINVAVIGIGKMGISHLAILGAHPHVNITGVCDASKLVTDTLSSYSPFPCFQDYRTMLSSIQADAAIVAVPTKFHAAMVEELLERKLHVFVEKPFCLDARDSEKLASLAENYALINQVGYHNRFLGTFSEVKRFLNECYLGDIYHFHAQSHGPVVVRPQSTSWRSKKNEGGGCLMDYASHTIDLIHYLLAPVQRVTSAQLKQVYSEQVEDAVYATMQLASGLSGMLSVNWSDDTYRKMTTSIQLMGKNGKLVADANELRVYFRSDTIPHGYEKGWNVRYITDLTSPVSYYLRGEEYTAQIDSFIRQIELKNPDPLHSFRSAAHTDNVIEMIRSTY